MTYKLTASDVLHLLSKATKLHINYQVYDYKETNEYSIVFEVDWFADDHKTFSYEKVIVNKDDSVSWNGDWEFMTFMNMMNEKVKEEEQKCIKRQKRQELINSLTPEQRELLDLI